MKEKNGSTTCFEKCSNSLMEEEEEDDSLDFSSSFILIDRICCFLDIGTD